MEGAQVAVEDASLEEITSLISVPITNCDVPDPRAVEAEFVYNFYVSGEDVAYNPDPTSPISYAGGLIDRESIERIEARERGALSARVPRFIRLRVSPFLDGIPALEPGELSEELLGALRASTRGARAYVAESEVENAYTARLVSSDPTVQRRVQSEVYRVAAALLEGATGTGDLSDQMVAMTLNELLSDDIDAAILMDALSDNTAKGYQFVNQVSGKRWSRFDLRQSVSLLSKVNAGGYRDLTTGLVASNPLSSGFHADLLGTAARPEERNWLLDSGLFRSFTSFGDGELESLQPNLTVLDASEELTAPSREALVALGYPTVRHAGYVVEKVATAPDGAQERFDDIVALNPNVTEFIDPLVKYGHTYTYRARQLFVARFIQLLPGDEAAADYRYQVITVALASSSPTPAVVRAVEVNPPNPPGTLICSFIYRAGNGLRLDWARPSNPTRDIKKYQVFRRRNFLEPFQLIAEYDFTDPGYTAFEAREAVNPSLVRRAAAPTYSHTDREFDRSSSYIYAVASVDAHGLTSGYGTQVLASFDRGSNTLATRIVSQAGAPKAYPNYFIDPIELEEFGSDRLVEDVIKDSGHGRMRIYFNPDAYRVGSDEDGTESQPIVLSSDRGAYKLQVTNLDRQASRVVTIRVRPDPGLAGLL